MSNTRLYECKNGMVYEFANKHCVFCKHCTDILYDYSNGPYCFLCDLGKKFVGGCDGFEDDGYVFDEAAYLASLQATLEARRLFEGKMANDPEFAKAYREAMDKAWQTILFGEPWGGEEE